MIPLILLDPEFQNKSEIEMYEFLSTKLVAHALDISLRFVQDLSVGFDDDEFFSSDYDSN